MRLRQGYIAKSGRVTEQLRNSVMGNPRFRVLFSDGTTFETARDSSVGYVIENSEYNGDVQIKLDNHGKIIDIEPLDV